MQRKRLVSAGVAMAIAASALLAGSTAITAAGAAGPVSSQCSPETAKQLAMDRTLNLFLLPDPVAQTLCGPFTGPGSNAMAITYNAPTCWSPQGWAVFTFTNGDWQLVLDQPLRFLAEPLTAVDGDIRETLVVRRSSDARCLPSGGTRARLWHWNGTRLTPGAFKQVKPPTPRPEHAVLFSHSPLNVTCELYDDGGDDTSFVYCWAGRGGKGSPHARLAPDGRLDRSTRQKLPTGLGGPTPPYGTRFTAGRFACASQRAGLRCTVTRTGKGFLFNNRGAKKVGP